jgi:hypothetical protein
LAIGSRDNDAVPYDCPLPIADLPSYGAIAQLGERVLCKHEVVGSIPSGSTRWSITGRLVQIPCRAGDTQFARHSGDGARLSYIVKRKHIRMPREIA